MQEDQLETFNSISEKAFLVKDGKVFIGGIEPSAEVLRVLKDQAFSFKTTNLYEVMRSTILNEAYDIALNQSGQSGNIEKDVNYAKMMKHWQYVIDNILLNLNK